MTTYFSCRIYFAARGKLTTGAVLPVGKHNCLTKPGSSSAFASWSKINTPFLGIFTIPQICKTRSLKQKTLTSVCKQTGFVNQMFGVFVKMTLTRVTDCVSARVIRWKTWLEYGHYHFSAWLEPSPDHQNRYCSQVIVSSHAITANNLWTKLLKHYWAPFIALLGAIS